MNESVSITSPDHMEHSAEKHLTRRSGNGYNPTVRCLVDWSILHSHFSLLESRYELFYGIAFLLHVETPPSGNPPEN